MSNGSWEVNEYSPGERVKGKVEVKCDDGYEFPGTIDSFEMICNESFWTPEEKPECQKKHIKNSVSSEAPKFRDSEIPPSSSEPMIEECYLPSHANNRKFMPENWDKNGYPVWIYNPGSRVTGVLDVQCEDGFRFADYSTISKIYCHQGGWIPEKIPTCFRTQSSTEARDTRRVVRGGCIVPEQAKNRRFLPETADEHSEPWWIINPGTMKTGLVYVRCEVGYALPGNKTQTAIFCNRGQWVPQAIPECKRLNAELEKPTRSDQLTRIARQSVSSNSVKCVLPENARNKIFTPYGNQLSADLEFMYLPGASVSGQVKVECEGGYEFPGDTKEVIIGCYNNGWQPEQVPECLKTCPPLHSASMYITCSYGSKRVNCSNPLLPTTTARYFCRPGYTEHSCLAAEGIYDKTLICESSGKWSHWLPECKPECGVSKEGGQVIPTVVNGTAVVQGQYPWHVGLYLRDKKSEDRYKYICGGSLISDRVVLTAAHCVSQFDLEDLKVAVGKYYRSWDHKEENAVRLNVSLVRVPPEYQSVATDYAFDIALLLLSERIAFHSFILPVCLDIHRDFDVRENATGYVVGWGSPETNEKPPENLLSSKLVINENKSCKKRLPRTLIFDKFCASQDTGITVQKGDSGGGITTVFNGLHYVFGIVSIRYIKSSIFTNITWIPHKAWLENEIDNFNAI